jgi:hypothetical protein
MHANDLLKDVWRKAEMLRLGGGCLEAKTGSEWNIIGIFSYLTQEDWMSGRRKQEQRDGCGRLGGLTIGFGGVLGFVAWIAAVGVSVPAHAVDAAGSQDQAALVNLATDANTRSDVSTGTPSVVSSGVAIGSDNADLAAQPNGQAVAAKTSTTAATSAAAASSAPVSDLAVASAPSEIVIPKTSAAATEASAAAASAAPTAISAR